MPTITADDDAAGVSTAADTTAKANPNQLIADASVTSTTSHPTNSPTGPTTVTASNTTSDTPPDVDKTSPAPEATATNAASDAAPAVNQSRPTPETTATASNAAPDATRVLNESRHAPETNATALNAVPGDDQSRLASVEFAAFYNDQSILTPKEKMAYIIMLMCDFDNVMLMEDDKHTTPEEYANKTFPYSEFIKTTGWKSKLILSKKIIAKEICRRKPTAKTNCSNITVPKMMVKLAQCPIINDDDIQFVRQENARFSMILENQIVGEEQDPETGAGRQKDTDRMRFIVLLTTNEDILEAYLQSTDSMAKETLDYRNSDERELDWIDLMLEVYNDPEVVVETPSVYRLHSKFRERIKCSKGGYEITREKCKAMIRDHKAKLREMIRKYHLSGNGSDMANFEDDTDNEEEVLECEETYGKFNAERASRRAHRRKTGKGESMVNLTTVDGDDRSSFLKNNPVDLLMW